MEVLEVPEIEAVEEGMSAQEREKDILVPGPFGRESSDADWLFEIVMI